MEGTGDVAQWGIIVGIVLPLVTALFQQPQFTPTVRRVVAVVVAVAAGLGTAYFNGEIGDTSSIVASVAAVLVASQATYLTLWARLAPAIEDATSPRQQQRGSAHSRSGG